MMYFSFQVFSDWWLIDQEIESHGRGLCVLAIVAIFSSGKVS